MLGTTYSHGLIRDYIISFGTLFNDIKINRPSGDGVTTATIAVPLIYSPKNKYLSRIEEDLNFDKPIAMRLPGMSFELLSMTYSAERKLNTMQRIFKANTASNTSLSYTYSPVPYDFMFQLNIFTKTIEDGSHIVEQILPYFTPEFTISLKGATDLDINVDMPIVLNSVAMEDNYEGTFEERRVIAWTLDFALKGTLFGPIVDGKTINTAVINFHANTISSNTFEISTIRPAMYANGTPTTDVEISVSANNISANDNYGIATDYSSFLGD
ncbi:MAG TPA: hypothetical protein EYN69_06260 [Flavobacteriales bacterium]|nr:hypothetical protein [Flavobacteriales bacterium]